MRQPVRERQKGRHGDEQQIDADDHPLHKLDQRLITPEPIAEIGEGPVDPGPAA